MTYHHSPWWLIIIDHDDYDDLSSTTLLFFHYLTTDILYGVPDKNTSYPYPKPLNNAPYPYPKPLKPSTNYTGNHLPPPTQTTPNTNHTEFNLELPKINHLYNTRRRYDIIYLCKPKTSWGKHWTSCFTRLVKSCTTIWTIILDPLNS
jgi:hypothetical protein